MNAFAERETQPSRSEPARLDRRAKILEIGPYPSPYDGWSMRIWVVKTGLEEAGHVCVPLNLGQGRRTPSPDYECVRSGWEYVRKLTRYVLRGYVFHVHTNGDSLKGFLLNLIAYFVSLLALRRPVLTLHAGTDQVYFPREKSRLMTPLLKFLFGVAKAVICDNPDVARRIVEYGITPRKVFPISPFTRQYLEVPPQILDENTEGFLKSHTPVILTYLEVRPEYDLDSVFKVVGELARRRPGLGLIVIGAVRERETISTRAHTADIADHCLHLSPVDHATFLSLLGRVSVYLRSARTEGTSASIREAVYLGTPVVANASDSHLGSVSTYSWGSDAAMLDVMESVLADSSVARKPQARAATLDVPDTVHEEVELLVRCAVTEPPTPRIARCESSQCRA